MIKMIQWFLLLIDQGHNNQARYRKTDMPSIRNQQSKNDILFDSQENCHKMMPTIEFWEIKQQIFKKDVFPVKERLQVCKTIAKLTIVLQNRAL